MKTQIYMGNFKLLEKSGIGRAMLHQKDVLKKQGIQVTEKMEKDIDIVHINTVLPDSVLVAIMAKLKRKKVVYYAHSTMEDFKNSFKGSNVIAPIFKKWIRFCYGLGDVIITPTEYSREILESYGFKKEIYSLSNGIDTDFYSSQHSDRQRFRDEYGISVDEKVIISVGHLIERKGILDFIEAANKMPHVKFIWFGDTNLKLIPNDIKDSIENAPENLIFAGYVSKEKLRRAYCSADLFAFMSHEETEGIVVLEALSCKIATIVRDIPVYEGWLKNDVHVHKAKNNEEMFLKIESILSEHELNLVENGFTVAKSRSITEISNKLNAIYEQLTCPANSCRPFSIGKI